MRALFCFITLFFCSIICIGQTNSKIDDRLLEAFEQNPNGYHTAYLILDDQVDVAAMNADFSSRNVPIPERQRATLKALTDKARETQPNFLDRLKEVDGIASITPLWFFNGAIVDATPAVYHELAMIDNIDIIIKPMDSSPAIVEKSNSILPPIPNGHEPGLDLINAPALWEMGYTGYGRTALIMDVGTDYTHPALVSNNKYHNSPLSEAWLGVYESPYVCGDHGTHVAGTVLGLNRISNDTIGVAYNAKFMHTPIFSTCENRIIDVAEAFQWSFNPDGDVTTTDDIPDVINYSGGRSNPSEGSCFNFLAEQLVATTIALNIAISFSAGNAGNDPGTIGYPANINNDIVHLFCVGNLDASSLEINPTSSIGPSNCESTGASVNIKPEVCAPGTLVRSCVLNSDYANFTGTSMAAPHVAGAYLLLKEAYPMLEEAEILKALYFSAIDLGPEGEDNTYGMGLIDLLAAYNYLLDLGFTPVPPVSADNDVIAVSAGVENILLCEGQTSIEVTFENAGINPLTSLDISISETNNQFATQTIEWTGSLDFDEIGTMMVPFTGGADGQYEVVVHLENPNGVVDERDVNNYFKIPVTYFAETEIAANISSEFIDPVCENAAVKLIAATPLAENQNYVWFGNNSDDPLGTGPVFVTDPISQPTTYSVDVYTKHNVGPAPDNNPIFLPEPYDKGLIFDVHVPLIINSVKVYAEDSGSIILDLVNSNGDSFGFKVVQVPNVGEQRIDVNMMIPPGNDYTLLQIGGKHLSSSFFNVSYPYEIDNIASIKSSVTEEGIFNSEYYYFYDWEVSAQHPCGQTEITINPGENLAALVDFSVESETFLLENATDILFTDNSENAALWSWDFGNGETSVLENPTTSFSEVGEYNVALVVTDMNGCVNSIQKKIVVTLEEIISVEDINLEPQLKVFPNPVEDLLYVQIPDQFSRESSGQLLVFNIIGTQIMSIPMSTSENYQEIQTDELVDGAYFLVYRSNIKSTKPTIFVKH